MTSTDFTASASASERRLHARQQVLLSCVRLAGGNGGIVLNVCERGLALRAARTLVDEQFTLVRFQLSQSDAWLETTGRIAWIDASRTLAGIEFADLSSEARTLLSEWISSTANESVSALVGRHLPNISVDQLSAASDEVSIPRPEPHEELVSEQKVSNLLTTPLVTVSANPAIDLSSQQSKECETRAKPPQLRGFRQEKVTPAGVTYRRSRFPRPIIVFATLTAAITGFVGLARFLRYDTIGAKKQEKATAGGPLAPSGVGTSSALASTSHHTLAALSVASDSAPGFVLQAGLMRHKENADGLVRSLQQRKFPAFISTSEASHFYEVLVGPYSGSQAAAKTKKELQEEGFPTIVRHWPLQ